MPSERFVPVCVAEHDSFGGGSVMVWEGIGAQGKTDLHVIENDTLTTVRYVNEILDVYVHPYAGAVGNDFILMDDNARAHRACITNQYLEQATILRMDRPARSPDLNPIEHAWDMLQTVISSCQVQPGSVQELLSKNGLGSGNITSGGLSAACEDDVGPLSMQGGTMHAIKTAKTLEICDLPDFHYSRISVDFPPLHSFCHIHAQINTTMIIFSQILNINLLTPPEKVTFLCTFNKIRKSSVRKK